MANFNMLAILILGLFGATLIKGEHEVYPVLKVDCYNSRAFVQQDSSVPVCHTFRELCGDYATITFNGSQVETGSALFTASVFLKDVVNDVNPQELADINYLPEGMDITSYLANRTLCLDNPCDGRPIIAGVSVVVDGMEYVEQKNVYFLCNFSNANLNLSFTDYNHHWLRIGVNSTYTTLASAMSAAGITQGSVSAQVQSGVPESNFMVSSYIVPDPYGYGGGMYRKRKRRGDMGMGTDYYFSNPTPSTIFISNIWSTSVNLQTDVNTVVNAAISYTGRLPCGSGKVVIALDVTYVFWDEHDRENNYVYWYYNHNCSQLNIDPSQQVCTVQDNYWVGYEMMMTNDLYGMINNPWSGWTHVYDSRSYGLLNLYNHITEIDPFSDEYVYCMAQADNDLLFIEYIKSVEGVDQYTPLSDIPQLSFLLDAMLMLGTLPGTPPVEPYPGAAFSDVIQYKITMVVYDLAQILYWDGDYSDYGQACERLFDAFQELRGIGSFSQLDYFKYLWLQETTVDITKCYAITGEPGLLGILTAFTLFDNYTTIVIPDLYGQHFIENCDNLPYYAQRLRLNISEDGAECSDVSVHKENICKAMASRKIAKNQWYKFGLGYIRSPYDGDLDCKAVPQDGPTRISVIIDGDVSSGYFNREHTQICVKRVATCTCEQCHHYDYNYNQYDYGSSTDNGGFDYSNYMDYGSYNGP